MGSGVAIRGQRLPTFGYVFRYRLYLYIVRFLLVICCCFFWTSMDFLQNLSTIILQSVRGYPPCILKVTFGETGLCMIENKNKGLIWYTVLPSQDLWIGFPQCLNKNEEPDSVFYLVINYNLFLVRIPSSVLSVTSVYSTVWRNKFSFPKS